ncbi:mitochondrial carrier [Trichoderma evansii]
MTTLQLSPLEKPWFVHNAEDIVHGLLAGIVGKCVEHPFDTIKVRLQSQLTNAPLIYSGPWDCFRQLVRSDGVLGLYRGLSMPLVASAAEHGALFVFERLGQRVLFNLGWARPDRELPLGILWLAGAFSGFFTSFFLTPLELVKCKIQAPASGTVVPARAIPIIRSVYQYEGTAGRAAWFGVKEFVTRAFHQRQSALLPTQLGEALPPVMPLALWQQAIAGASGGVAYNFILYPADTIKSRMQTMPVGHQAKEGRAFWNEGIQIWRYHGLRGFYHGCGITCLRSAPSSALIFIVYDELKRHVPFS